MLNNANQGLNRPIIPEPLLRAICFPRDWPPITLREPYRKREGCPAVISTRIERPDINPMPTPCETTFASTGR